MGNLLNEEKQSFLEFRKKELELIKSISELHKAYYDKKNNYDVKHLRLRRLEDPSFDSCDHTQYLTSKDYEEFFGDRIWKE